MRQRTAPFLRLGERLLRAGEEPLRPVQVAEDLGVPSSTLHDWLRQLRFQRVLLETARGEVVDTRRLLQFYAAHRMARIYPSTTLSTDLAPAALSRFLQQRGVRHSLAMLTAANEWAFFEPRRRLELYVDRRDVAAARRQLASGATPVDVFAENVAELLVAPRAGVHVTTAFLTALDCRAHPEGGAHAEFLERNVLLRGRP